MQKFLFILIFSCSLSAQILGVVKDSITGEPISYVNIWVENENIGTTSETNGSFSLDIQEEKVLVFSTLGYESKKLSSKNEIILLKPKVFELNEVEVKFSKQNKEIEIGDTKKVFYLPEPQSIPWIFARRFYLDENNLEVKYVKEIIYFTNSEVQNGIFRARVYNVKNDGMPGEDLILDELIVEAKKGKHQTKVDISKYNIQIPKEGIIVSFECLIVEQNKFLQKASTIKSKEKFTIVNYSPHIMYFHNDYFENYNFRSGKWLYFSKEYNEKYRNPVPAINLTLTN